MIVEAGDGVWLATIRCHGEDVTATVAFQTLSDAFQALEAVLRSPAVAWRPYETWKGKGRQATPPKKKA